MKLTTQSVSALIRPQDKADHVAWDDELPGFGVRLRGDSKRWVIQYRVGIAQRREILGDVRKVRIEDARKIARQRFAKAELGVDPAAEKTKARVAAAAAKLTLASVADGYLAAKQQAVKNGSYTESTYEATALFQCALAATAKQTNRQHQAR